MNNVEVFRTRETLQYKGGNCNIRRNKVIVIVSPTMPLTSVLHKYLIVEYFQNNTLFLEYPQV